jgi:hypothetical protein
MGWSKNLLQGTMVTPFTQRVIMLQHEKINQALSATVCAIAIALSVWIINANDAKAQETYVLHPVGAR